MIDPFLISDQAVGDGNYDRLLGVHCIKFVQDISHVKFNGPLADIQDLGSLPGCFPDRRPGKNLMSPRRQFSRIFYLVKEVM